MAAAAIGRLPLDKIKVDRSFVTDINDNPVSLKIIKSLTGLCDDIRLLRQARQIQPLVTGAVDRDVVARIRMAHDAGGRIVP